MGGLIKGEHRPPWIRGDPLAAQIRCGATIDGPGNDGYVLRLGAQKCARHVPGAGDENPGALQAESCADLAGDGKIVAGVDGRLIDDDARSPRCQIIQQVAQAFADLRIFPDKTTGRIEKRCIRQAMGQSCAFRYPFCVFVD